jgi:hypothetical protein
MDVWGIACFTIERISQLIPYFFFFKFGRVGRRVMVILLEGF